MIKLFDNNPWLNVLFLILSIVSIALAYFFYYKSIKEKKPVYNWKTYPLFQPNPIVGNKIEIKYNGNQIDNLSLTKFAFWNAGRESIRYEDIAPNDPFLIIVDKGVNILDFQIVEQNTINNFSLEKINDQTIKVNFDFTDFNDGIIVNIFHSRLRKTGLTVMGTFIGAKRIAHGIRKDKLAAKTDILAKPVNHYLEKKGFFNSIMTLLLMIPTIAIFIPLLLIVLPIDQILNKVNNKFEKKYFLGD